MAVDGKGPGSLRSKTLKRGEGVLAWLRLKGRRVCTAAGEKQAEGYSGPVREPRPVPSGARIDGGALEIQVRKCAATATAVR